MSRSRALLLLAVLLTIIGFFALDGGQYLRLETLQAQRETLSTLKAEAPLRVAFGYFAIYVLVTALSLPGAAVMTLAGGALFGFWWGLALVSVASSLGATLAMLVARHLLRDGVQRRLGDRLRALNEGIRRDGAFYLFSLRLVPVFPFFAVNLLMGLTPIRTWTFYWVSQLGMLAGTAVYVNAGQQLGQLQHLGGILSPGLLGAFALLGVFPFVARALSQRLRARRAYRGYRRPARFDRNLIVIGGGAAGLVSAYIGAAVKARVTLVESRQMGGDCLNTGCVPSKALIRAAHQQHEIGRAAEYGIEAAPGRVDFTRVMARVRAVIGAIEPHDSVARYTAMGVDVRLGHARLIDPWTVVIRDAHGEEHRLTARHIIIATGAAPVVPALPGLADTDYVTSETVWSLPALPRRLVVLGGGPIGCELAQAFARLGSQVTLVEAAAQLMMREDAEVADTVTQRFRREGVTVHLDTRALAVETGDGERRLRVQGPQGEAPIPFDTLLIAVGRQARLEGFGLETLGIRTGQRLEVNEVLQTSMPNVFACGDVAGPYQFTHTAAHMAWYAAVNSLFAPLLWLRGGPFKVDYRVIPHATFTDPEVARVGLNEREAEARGIAYEVTRYPLAELDRAIAEGDTEGFVKVLTPPGRDRILGATVVGARAGDLIAEYVLAMRHGIGLNKLLGTIHVYPTLAEASKYAAGQWKQAHAPQRLLRWVEAYHRWRRG